MLAPNNQFQAYIRESGLSVIVSPGTAMVGGSLVNVPLTKISLTGSRTNFIFFNPVTGTIQANTTAVPTQCLPIAVVTTGQNSVSSIVDSRPDFLLSLV